MSGNRKILGSAVAHGLVMLAAWPAQADLLDDIMEAKKIRIATDLAIPPSGMMDSTMKPTGSDVEAAQLLAKDWGLERGIHPDHRRDADPERADRQGGHHHFHPVGHTRAAKVIDFSKRYATLQSVIGGPKPLNVRTGRT